MLNARTWHGLHLSGYSIFLGILMTWFLPENSYFLWLALWMIFWGIIIGLFGAVQAILLALGRLKMGCPQCNQRSCVTGAHKGNFYLNCPVCGDLRLKLGGFFGLKVFRGVDEEDCPENPNSSGSILLIPWKHSHSFLLLFLPVLISIIVASIIHKFTFFYIMIPGFWCYAVACFIIDGIAHGRMSDNHGIAFRAKTPIRFWGKVFIWSLFYISRPHLSDRIRNPRAK